MTLAIYSGSKTVLGEPGAEPLSLAEAKVHCKVPANLTAHDAELTSLITVARKQFEKDTGWLLASRLATVYLWGFCEHQFTYRPVSQIGWVHYYDTCGVAQMLDASVYTLDIARHQLRLSCTGNWPSTQSRWDAVSILATVGQSMADANALHALKLLIGYYFYANKGDNDRAKDFMAYERLTKPFIRGGYAR